MIHAIHRTLEWPDYKQFLRAQRYKLMEALATPGLPHDESNLLRGQIIAILALENGDIDKTAKRT
jgi:hypothetical protein